MTVPVRRQVIAASPPTEAGVNLGSQPVTVGLDVQPAAAAEAFAPTEAGIPGAAIVLDVEGIDFDRPPDVYYEIYVNLPASTAPDPQSIFYAGNLGFFAQKMPPHHPGAPAESGAPSGGVHNYNITQLVREQRARNLWRDDRVAVTFVMRGLELPGGQEATLAQSGNVRVGRVAISRE